VLRTKPACGPNARTSVRRYPSDARGGFILIGIGDVQREFPLGASDLSVIRFTSYRDLREEYTAPRAGSCKCARRRSALVRQIRSGRGRVATVEALGRCLSGRDRG